MTSTNVNPHIAQLTPYKPGKPVEELTRELGITDVVKLASNENPQGPGAAVQAAILAAATELSRYPDGNGYYLKQALANQLGVNPEQITLGNGSNDVLDLAAKICLQPGDEAIASQHSFVVYRLATLGCGARLVEVPAQNYGADLRGFVQAVTPKTRLVFLANPNNPTGTWVAEAALVEFLDALDPNIWVVLDEAYFEYVDAPDYPDGMALQQRYPNLIVTRTFSKIHGLAALRVGYGVSSMQAADLMNRARQPFNVNAIALAAAVAALADTHFVQTSAQRNRDGLAQLTSGLTEQGFGYIPSAGNFVCFDAGSNAAQLNQALLQAGVIVRPVAEYGLTQHLRVTVGLPSEIERFLAVLSAAVKALG
jgi:histidinol-phosphate aminotransferase